MLLALYLGAFLMEQFSANTAWLTLNFGFRFISATPMVVREVLGVSSAVLKISARPSVENTATSLSSVMGSSETSGLLSE